jgi:peptide/nickel transport system substrate-binding protein
VHGVRRLPVLIVPLILVLGACSAPAQPKPPAPPKVAITVDAPTEPATLSPIGGFAPDGAAKLYDGLVEHQPVGGLAPALAASMPTPDPSGTSWTVPLRQNVKFSDGTELRAEDVAATYNAVLDPNSHSPLRTEFAALRTVRVVNPTTVRFELTRPDPAFLSRLVLGVVSAKSLRDPTKPPVGTGPYYLAEWQRGKQLKLTARKDYVFGAPTVDTVIVRFEPDDARRLADLKSGTADVAPVAPTATLGSFDQVTVRSAQYLAVSMPQSNPVTSDPVLRKALNFAVDRKQLVAKDLGGAGDPASTPITDATPEFVDPNATYSHDVTSARSLLENAGWVAHAGGVREKHGVPARFPLRYNKGDTMARRAATAFAADVKALGVIVTPTPSTGDHPEDPAIISGGDPFDPDPGTLSAPASSVRKALATARAETDPAQRAVAYRGFDLAYLGAPTMVVLARLDHSYLVNDKWHGYSQQVVDPARVDFSWGLLADLEHWTT